MGIKSIITSIFVFIFLQGCKKDAKTVIDEKVFEPITTIDRYIENYYRANYSLPKTKKDLIDFFNVEMDTLFINKIQKNKTIRYVPLYSREHVEPLGYYLLSTNKNFQDIKLESEQSILKEFVTPCEYNRGKDGDIILSYGTAYLISSDGKPFNLTESFAKHWRERIYFNVKFTIDSTALKNEKDLDFIFQKDSITIIGKYFNADVKERVVIETQKGHFIQLQGFKMRNLDKNKIELRDVIMLRKEDSIFGKYYNEIGNLKDYKQLRGCD